MNNDDIVQYELNKHLRRVIVFIFDGVEYKANLNLTKQYVGSLEQLEPKLNLNKKESININTFYIIQKYLKDEGFFDY